MYKYKYYWPYTTAMCGKKKEKVPSDSDFLDLEK